MASERVGFQNVQIRQVCYYVRHKVETIYCVRTKVGFTETAYIQYSDAAAFQLSVKVKYFIGSYKVGLLFNFETACNRNKVDTNIYKILIL